LVPAGLDPAGLAPAGLASAGRSDPFLVDGELPVFGRGLVPDPPEPELGRCPDPLGRCPDPLPDPVFGLVVGRSRVAVPDLGPDPGLGFRPGVSFSSARAGGAPTMPRRNSTSCVPIRMALDTMK
jgi:hypothetical protein